MSYKVDSFTVTEVTTSAKGDEHMDWAIKHIGADRLPYRGKGQRVGVLDTGCDIDHQDLKGKVTAANFISGNTERPAWRDTCGHGCIQPEARILTSTHGLVPIAEFYDKVAHSASRVSDDGMMIKDISHLGAYTIGFNGKACVIARITHVHRLQHVGKVYRVRGQGKSGPELLLTPWHPVYVVTSSRGKERTVRRVRADALKPGYKLVMNDAWQSPGSRQQLAYEYGHNSHSVSGGRRDIEITPDVAWLLGYILTDGHIIDRRVSGRTCAWLAIDRHASQRELLYCAQDIIATVFGLRVTVKPLKRRADMLELKVFGRGFVGWLQAAGIPAGVKSRGVTVPPVIARSDADVIAAFVGGCVDGDGSVAPVGDSKHGHIRLVSASKRFADGLTVLLRSVGIPASCYVNKGYEPSTFGACDTHVVSFKDVDRRLHVRSNKKRVRMVGTSSKRRRHIGIVAVREEAYDGYMYDLTVDGVHSYLAEGVVVSNTFCIGEIVARADGRGVVGIAPEATAFSARVLYGSRKDETRQRRVDLDIADAISACVDQRCGVISMSLGGSGKSRELEAAVNYATNAGIIIVAAAGNERLEGSPYVSYPAGYRNVISVAAANKRGMPAWFSTAGRGADKTQQPEIAIASLEYYWGCLPGRSTYGRMIGTSMATPMLAGVALLWREAMTARGVMPKPGAGVLRAFRDWLYRVADDTNKNGWDPELGYGVLLLQDGEL